MLAADLTPPPPPPSSIAVKPVGPFDLGRLSRLHKLCFTDGWSRSDLAQLLALPGGFGLIARQHSGGFVALDGFRSVGFSLCRIASDESELLSIGVVPAHRRHGVATTILRASMQRCRNSGARKMFLEAAVDNHPALQLYQDNGFQRVGTRPDYYVRRNGERISAYTMRCDLESSLPRLTGC